MFKWMFGGSAPADVLARAAKVDAMEKELDGLRDERRKLKDEVEDLKSKRKVEDEQLKHLLKIKEEKMDLEYQKKEAALESRKQDEIAKVKDQYRDKLETELRTRGTELKEMYGQILARLPDVSMAITGKVGKR